LSAKNLALEINGSRFVIVCFFRGTKWFVRRFAYNVSGDELVAGVVSACVAVAQSRVTDGSTLLAACKLVRSSWFIGSSKIIMPIYFGVIKMFKLSKSCPCNSCALTGNHCVCASACDLHQNWRCTNAVLGSDRGGPVDSLDLLNVLDDLKTNFLHFEKNVLFLETVR
jgi:hypothetical protein